MWHHASHCCHEGGGRGARGTHLRLVDVEALDQGKPAGALDHGLHVRARALHVLLDLCQNAPGGAAVAACGALVSATGAVDAVACAELPLKAAARSLGVRGSGQEGSRLGGKAPPLQHDSGTLHRPPGSCLPG